MALSQSALSELLDAIRAGGSADVMRDAMTLVLQQLIELEADQAIGAGRYERSEARMTHRNGSRGRLLSTKAGDVELRIPKLGTGVDGASIIGIWTASPQLVPPSSTGSSTFGRAR